MLIGRDFPRESILTVAGRALLEGGAVLVTGEPGLGKTTLLADVATRLDGWAVVRVHADSFESDLGYATVETLVRGLNTRTASRVRAPDPTDSAITVGRLLLDAVDGIGSPVAILIDDAQWVDEASARALRFTVRRLVDQPFLLIAATRPNAGNASALFDGLAAALPNGARIDLTPFTVDDTQELANRILGHAVSRRTAARLTEATQGSPLLLNVLLVQLRESFAEALHPAGWEIPIDAAVPLSGAVAAALDGTDPSVRAAAEVVAVLRDPIPVPFYGTIADRLGLVVDVDTAIERGLVASKVRDGVVWLEPAHAILADAITADLLVARRVEIHRVAASVLSGHRALRHRVEAADRADPTLVAELMAASREAAELGHAGQAMSYARSAVHLSTAGDERERALIEIGMLALRTRLHERIFDLVPAIEELRPSPPRDAILVELRTLTGNISGALALGLALQAAPATSAEERVLRAHVACALPMVQMATRDFGSVLGQIDIARSFLATSPTHPDEVADPAVSWLVQPREELLRLLGWLITAASHMGRTELLAASVDELDTLLDGPGSPAVVDALVSRASVFIRLGDIDRALDDLERANDLIRLFPSSWTAGHGRSIYAHVLFLLGEWDESVTVADTAVALALDETDLSAWPIALTVSTLVRAGRGKGRAVEERLASAGEARPGISGSYDTDLPFIARAEAARAAGDRLTQLAATEPATREAAASSTLGWLTYRIDALAALGRSDEARAELAVCDDRSRLWRPYYGSLSWLEGRVLEAEGHADAAITSYLLAADSPASARLPFPHAVTMLDAGRLLATEGRHPEAVDLLERAAAVFRRLGAADYLARCTEQLEALRRAGAETALPTTRDDPFADLTTRERQVAHALAAGMTNKEIAEHLYVSVTTVNFHVRNILAKLRISSRRELRSLARAARDRSAPSGRRPDRTR
ncbi:AAA family ATPase [Diaminobutyricibacter tongyongensis]|uniref:AAA family ATPase n=2 Tax=Leifsonia tongyongensis TaxID=1268043 RepID=A0A6L9Y0I3_9MICO|nr:LuxR C-terminal-related transcriptional regulator [Diaminobutyricibacter tongyongensis]NEN07161.1 AAA family ATPase [Diaminobutyricibacter tongyongensis]